MDDCSRSGPEWGKQTAEEEENGNGRFHFLTKLNHVVESGDAGGGDIHLPHLKRLSPGAADALLGLDGLGWGQPDAFDDWKVGKGSLEAQDVGLAEEEEKDPPLGVLQVSGGRR